jgi:hypothetical protein
MKFKYNDGGRSEAGFKGVARDCVTRAIAIVSEKPYMEVYKEINDFSQYEKVYKKQKSKSNARTGVYKRTYKKYLNTLGFAWIPTVFIGKGCIIHLKENELRKGRLIVKLSGHLTAVVDGVINDIYNPDRGETRCVYGYFIKEN